MPKHKKGLIPNRYSLIHSMVSSSSATGSSESVDTRNILNGVLNCAWNRTSATPKLLEIANGNQVKLNIDSDNPLVLAFANGWDDKDRPGQIVKSLSTAPPNIDLSGKANRHVQIVARVINDELVITTQDVLDLNIGYGTSIKPSFATSRGGTDAVATKDGWTVQSTGYDSTNYPWKSLDGANGTDFKGPINGSSWLMIDPPCAISISKIATHSHKSYAGNQRLAGWDGVQWVDLLPPVSYTILDPFSNVSIDTPEGILAYSRFGLYVQGGGGSSGRVSEILAIYERPAVKFFRFLNKVKDRSDTEVYWINLGYATMDESGNISALYHYTDLRNNYPGGMRVEP